MVFERSIYTWLDFSHESMEFVVAMGMQFLGDVFWTTNQHGGFFVFTPRPLGKMSGIPIVDPHDIPKYDEKYPISNLPVVS